MDAFLEFARGPLFIATFLFMVFGLGRHVTLRTRDLIRVLKRTPKRDVPWKDFVSSSASWVVPVNHILRAVPVLSIASVLFHAGLVLYAGSEIVPFGERLHAVPVPALWEAGT